MLTEHSVCHFFLKAAFLPEVKCTPCQGHSVFYEEGVTVFGRVQEQTEEILTGVFMLILAAGVALLVYGGIQKDKYNIENYNKEGNPSPEKKKKDSLIGMLCGCIFLAATAIYLVWSFMMDSWAVSWIVFAVAGLLCGIVALVVSGGRDEGNQA